jgi:hypothetical protein
MKLLVMMRENPYANGAAYYFAPGAAGQWRGLNLSALKGEDS